MIANGHNFKIGRLVVQAIFIFVVYVFFGGQFSLENPFHDDAVLPAPSPITTFHFPVLGVPLGAIRFLSTANRTPLVISFSAVPADHLLSSEWIFPISKTSTTLPAIQTCWFFASEVNGKRVAATGALPQPCSAFFTGPISHISILHQQGPFCKPGKESKYTTWADL